VPSGASTGKYEAVERRDGDSKVFGGKGVLQVVEIINTKIRDLLVGRDSFDQKSLDISMIELDGTDNKSNFGANAILGTSLSIAKASSLELNIPLYRYIGGIGASRMPMPFINILNGGAHSNNNIDIQEFMVVPIGAESFSHAIRIGAEVFSSLRSEVSSMGMSTSVGDEGGLSPNLESVDDAFSIILKSIKNAGYTPGKDVALALDVAANELLNSEGEYCLGNNTFSNECLVDFYKKLVDSYPIISIEDGMSEDDFDGWRALTNSLGSKIQLIGDDLFVTNITKLQYGIDNNIANSILIKPNQIGTLSETISTINTATRSGYKTMISHRSGETEDTTISDLAVATNSGQIKTGSLCRTDRLCKYNQLLRIEEQLGNQCEFYSNIKV
jgi:enolase